MKTFVFQIFILLFLIQSVEAQTDTVYIDSPGIVGGTWTSDNRYIARWDILVPYDSVLTIQPGVKIEIQDGYSFKVEGQLNAVGNAGSLIEISPYGSDWKGMSFGTPSGEQEVNSSLLSYVDIDCGGFSTNSEAVLLGKHIINSLNNLTISNAGKAIRVTGFATIDNISDCEFADVNRGIVFQYCDFVSDVLIEDCSFNNIHERAIVISQNQAFLENITISSCEFDNSALQNNLSESAVYITLNEMLSSVTLNDNNFNAFAINTGSTACIYIFNNLILNSVSLNRNEISGCGGESIASPSADFGGVYVNHSLNVFLDENNFSANTGINSGGAYFNAGNIYFSDNIFLNNRNNYDGNENFAGAITFHVGNRIEFSGDRFESNISAKSGGAMYIESLNAADPIDLLFGATSLLANNAENEGGAVLINAALDTLGISSSTITGNFSSAGSGGCFSIISVAFNDFSIESNTIRDNFVSNTSNGGFLFLRHNPSIIPDYGNIRMSDNEISVLEHYSDKNYNLIFSVIKSFPGSISITGDHVTDFYPVNGYLYHFGLLQSGPDPSEEDVLLSLSGNEYQGNECPLFYVSNAYANLSVLSSENTVHGEAASFGTFLTLECLEVPSLMFQHEDYFDLISGTSGGAVSVNTLHEIGYVNMQDVLSYNCFSVEGNGGHFSLVSGNADPDMDQSLLIIDSEFTNSDMNNSTGGDGGAIYYKTPGHVDTILIRYSDFNTIYTDGSGGAIYIDTKGIGDASLEGSDFEHIFSENGDGAVCLYAGNGNINSISFTYFLEENTDFNECYSHTDGGAFSARASGEIGKIRVESISSVMCQSTTGNGGHFSFVSLGSDPALMQDLIISNALFENTNTNPFGNHGGAMYYTSSQPLDSLSIAASSFENFKTLGDGGDLYLSAKEIGLVTILNSGFSGQSVDNRGGGLYLNASNGNIGAIDLFNVHFANCTAKMDGGAACFSASREIGTIHIDSLQSQKCYSSDGNGGHLAFISGSGDPALDQEISISNSSFDNSGITNVIGGNGGAIYYFTPVDLDAININTCLFTGLKAGKKAGALCAIARETADVSFLGSSFSLNSSLDTAGAIYLNATNGSIGNLLIAPYDNVPTTFTSCNAKYDGGAICAVASKEIGTVILDSLQMEKCYSHEGSGGHLSVISRGTDPAVVQQLNISGSSFSNQGISNITGENGGILYYSAVSDVTNINISRSAFTKPRAVKDGGSLCIKAGKIDSFELYNSLFSSSASEVLSGGAVYVNTINGLIEGNFSGNRFINCTSNLMGGSVFVEDAKYDNTIENASFSGNTYRIIDVDGMPETGGAIYCKGISSLAFVSDSVISQSASEMGGFAYLEKVYHAAFDSVYTYNNKAGNGGTIYHKGDAESSFNQSTRIFNSTFLFNTAEITGGCFYITDIDSVEIGQEGYKNTFVSNQSLLSAENNYQVGGGVLFIDNAQRLDINYNSFYVNTSQNNGGIGIVSNVSSNLLIEGNTFLSNQAKAGGTFAFFNSFGNGIIAGNNFSFNSTSEQAGAILFSPAATNSFIVNDNTFFQNATGKLGGAIASYRPVRLIRNLFRENQLVDINPTFDHMGTTIYFSGDGDQSLIKNCVFDQNYYEEVPAVASVYYDTQQSPFPSFSIANCSFFNFSDEHLSVYNANGMDTVRIENSIFTQRQNISRDDYVTYFNETVKSRYSDLIYSQINDTVDHNYDEYVYFNVGAYYFDSEQYPVDKGNPDPAFNDFNFPTAYGELRNDLGVSGGPDNPDTNGVFIFEEPVNLPNNFAIVVTRDCFTFTFKCMGEFVEDYEYFYWFMPDTIILSEEPELTYTFSPDLTGTYSITALGSDVNNADSYGFGQYTVNLDIIRILSLTTDDGNTIISVPSVPFTFNIEAVIDVENEIEYTWDWSVTNSQGVEYVMTGYELLNVVEIQKILSLPASITIKYSLHACGKTEESTINIELQPANQWGYPSVSFYPLSSNIIDSTSFFIIEFDKIMTKASGEQLADEDIDSYITLTRPSCPGLTFRKSVEYTTTKTVFTFEQINENTQEHDILCNGEYRFDVNCDELYTQFYFLAIDDESKSYTVCCNEISEISNSLNASVYPNPFRDIIHIGFNQEDDYYFEVSNLQGQVQKSGIFNACKEVTLNLGALSDGFYILNIVNSRKTDNLYLKINKITY